MLTRKRLILSGLIAVLVSLVGFAVYAGWLAGQVKADLAAARDDARELRSALEAGDRPAAEAALAALRGHVAEASEGTGTLTWSALGHVPVAGDDVEAVGVATDVLDDLARDGLAPLVASAALDPDGFAPVDGRLDLDAVAGLQRPLASGAAAFAAARERLDAVEADGFGEGFAEDWSTLTGEIADAADALAAGETAARLLPEMLGDSGARHQLLVFQTPAEPRAAGGGMPGSLAVLDARNGRLALGAQRSASSFGPLEEPVLPVTAEEEQAFGAAFGEYVMDAAFTPHFPRSAELIAARWNREEDQQVDGVVALDPVTLGYLLEGTITVQGVELSSENVAEQLLHGAYLSRDPEQQDAFFEEVARKVFDRISSGEMEPRRLVEALARGVREGRVLLWSSHDDEQAELTGSRIAGELADADGPAEVGVFLNDATASKMGWFLDYGVTVASSCDAGSRVLTGTLEIRSTLEPGTRLPESVTGPGTFGVERGDHLVAVEVFGVQRGTLGDFSFDGEPVVMHPGTYRDHPHNSVAVFLEPGASHTVTWRMETAERGAIRVAVAPGVQPEDESSTVPAC